MAVTLEQRQKVIQENRTHDGDTGSPEVQIALLTARINDLAAHFQTHVKDHHSRRGLLKLVSHRKQLLNYLQSAHIDRYRTLIKKLGLRH